MSYWCGYNPGFTNTVTGIQAGLAGLNGIINYFDARNNGANPMQAASYGISSTAAGVGNALLGNAIDKTTHSYLGSTMNSVMTSFTGGNPFAASVGMTGTALATSLFMRPPMPMFGSFGYVSAWSTPMMFGGPMMMPMGGPMMFGMPAFGGFCCRC